LGFLNFQPVLNFINSQQVLFNDIFWTVSSVALQTLLGLSVALVLWQKGVKFKRGWQTLFILPWAIPEMIGALMWSNVFTPTTGWLALAVQKYGPEMPFASLLNWEKDPNLWFIVLLICGVWYGFPFMMLAATAGLKMLPMECYESAQIDGASSAQMLRYLTIPLVYPLVVPAIIIRGIFAFNQFYLFQSFHIPTVTLATLSYNIFNPSGNFLNGQFAISAIINLITVLILIAFVLLFNRVSHMESRGEYA
jgi:arabinogalactan oligomer/maltooligosaccharide transport system permease protein